MDKEISPVEINNTHEWDEMVDTRLQLVVLLDDVLGKYGVSETDLDRWKKISELIHPRFSGSSIFLIICIRTQIASFIKLSLRRNEAFFMFNSNVVDISAEPHRLTKAEREQMLKKYVPQGVDRNEKSATEDIVEMENVIGFAQNCKIAGSTQNLPVELKEIFSNNTFLTEEIKDMSKKSLEMYTFLVLLMLSGGCLSLENKQKELNNKLKTLSDHCGLKKLTIKEMKEIGHSLSGTLLEYIKQRETFKFQHDCTETAVFVSFGNDYPYIILENCSLKQLSKMCCVANEHDLLDYEEFLSFKIKIRDDHFRVLCDRFNEALECGGRDSFKSIAEGLVWKSQNFVDHFSDAMALGDNVLNFLSKTDPDGHSLLIHLVNAKSTLAVKGIIKNISQCCLQDNDPAARQLLLATTNACLTEEETMLNDFIKLRGKVDDFVMLAAASTGNVSVMETLVLQGGNINATISTKQRNANDLSNDIKNCISHPKISRYHHDINLFHIACRYGLMDMVRYLTNNYTELVQKTSALGRTAVHFLAYAENLELMKALCEEQIYTNDTIIQSPRLDISSRDNDGTNVLHIAAENDNIPIVKYLIENNPSLTLQTNNDGWTAIHYATRGGSVPVIEALIQAGLDLNARTTDDAHVLHIAAEGDNLPIVKYLIKSNPSLTLQNDSDGWTAIHYAAKGGSAPVIEALIQAGLDLNARTNNGAHVLHIAAQYDNLPIIKYLIENNPSLTLQNDKDGWTAMHCAAEGGSAPVIEALIQAGLDLSTRTNNGAHVLHIAALNDNLPIVKYLIEHNPSLTLQQNMNGWTAIHCAAHGSSAPVIEALRQAGLDLNAKTNYDSNILHIATLSDNLPVVKYLIENNPSLTLHNDKDGWTAIHYAAEGGSVPVIEALIQAGLDLNARTNNGAHVMHIAVRNDNLPVVKYLIENNPSLILLTDKNGWTAIHYAAQGGSAPVAEALIQAGLDLNARTNNGANVLHIAAWNDNLPIVKYFIKNNPSLTLQDDMDGWTAIHYAAKGGSAPVIEALIQAGLNLNARTNVGAHVLHIAAENDNLTIVKYLIENNPSLTLQNDMNGWTAIHYAAKGGSAPVMEALIQAGLDISSMTNVGAHVLHIAAMNNNLMIVLYLIEINLPVMLQSDNDGRTAIHYAAEGGSVAVMETLIQAGLNINARTNNGAHVLHIAAGNDNLAIVEYVIIMNPPMILEKDNDGWTALDYADQGDSSLVLETLIQAQLELMH